MLKRALHVDDDADIGMIVQLSLELDNTFEVRFVDNGFEALEVAKDWKPDVIILDVMMPQMDGPTTFSKLRGDETTSDIPVIFLTAKASPEEQKELLALGARGTLVKPFDPTSLRTKVSELMQ